MSASHEHALTLTWGPTCPLLNYTPSISENINNAGVTHNTLGFILPYILHYHVLILILVISASFSTFLTMTH